MILAISFCNTRSIQNVRMKENPQLFCKKHWKTLGDSNIKEKIIYIFQKKLNCEWNMDEKFNTCPILPVVHATNTKVAWNIVAQGFAALSTGDEGFYGRGIYFSTSAQYVLPYCKNPTSAAILICLTLPGNPFPTTEFPNSKLLMGKPIKSGYQSHYVITSQSGLPFTSEEYEEFNRYYDELVLDQESQVLPIFLTEIHEDTFLSKKYKLRFADSSLDQL